jgi:hypothetical protein
MACHFLLRLRQHPAPALAPTLGGNITESLLYISADVHVRVFTSGKFWYYRMQWPRKVLVFPFFPTLLGLIKKRAAPYPHAIATSTVVTPRVFPPSSYPTLSKSSFLNKQKLT